MVDPLYKGPPPPPRLEPLLLEALRDIQRMVYNNLPRPIDFARSGICPLAVRLVCLNSKGILRERPGIGFDLTDVMRTLFVTWPEYSGCKQFPISICQPPSSTGHPSSEENVLYHHCHQQYTEAEDLWTPYSEYGRRRRRLLDHMVTQLEASLQNR